MNTAPDKPPVASELDACRRRLRSLRASGVSTANFSRLLVEPIVRWIGFDTTSDQSVRREVPSDPRLPPISLLCIRAGKPHLAIVVCADFDGRTTLAYAASFARTAGPGPELLAFTDGDEWRVFRVADGRRAIPLFGASLAAPQRLLTLGPAAEVGGATDPISATRPSRGPASSLARIPPRLADPLHPSAASPNWKLPEKPPVTPAGPRSDPGHAAPAREAARVRSYKYIRADETHTSPAYVEVQGRRRSMTTWADVVMFAADEHLRRRKSLPEQVLEHQRFPYASRRPGALRRPRLVRDGWFVETNMSAHLACRVSAEFLLRAGLADSEFNIMYNPRG
ncbi:MAG: hypothetical protein V4850_17780 [Myxococcota bacterium]